jgi:hypothetical protein
MIVEDVEAIDDDLADGYDAFLPEVRESNERHALLSYLLDTGLQPLVRDLVHLAVVNAFTPPKSTEEALAVIQTGTRFLLDVVLHCRERAGMPQWIVTLREAFSAVPKAAHWFVLELTKKSGWLIEFLFSPDPLARATFGELLCEAFSVAAPNESKALIPYMKRSYPDIDKCAGNGHNEACAFVVSTVVRTLYESPTRMRSTDEILIIIRELATIPSVCEAMLEVGVLEDLVYFIIPDRVPDSIRNRFRVSNTGRVDPTTFIIIQNVFEALAALLGVPQKRKLNLLEENCSFWEPEFIPIAKEAFITIFEELAQGSSMLEGRLFMSYYEKLHGVSRNSALLIRNILERFESTDGKLSLNGFCKYHAELAVTAPKTVWKVSGPLIFLLKPCTNVPILLFVDFKPVRIH